MTRTSRNWTLGIALLALNAQFCPCPASAAETADTDGAAHAHHQTLPVGDSTDCHGESHRADCDMAAGEAPEAALKANDRADDQTAVLPERTAMRSLQTFVTRYRTLRPPGITKLPSESPVRRADLLLD